MVETFGGHAEEREVEVEKKRATNEADNEESEEEKELDSFL